MSKVENNDCDLYPLLLKGSISRQSSFFLPPYYLLTAGQSSVLGRSSLTSHIFVDFEVDHSGFSISFFEKD